MLWDKEKQTWQDKFAGSVVVPVDAYRYVCTRSGGRSVD